MATIQYCGGVITGFAAVDRLVSAHPDAHLSFGAHTPEGFRIALSCPGWLVMEEDGCWIALERTHHRSPVCELHWYCPTGARLPALRSMLHEAFTNRRVLCVIGAASETHPYAREAATLAHALGASRYAGKLVLTAERFQAYNAAKLRRG